MEKKNYAYLLRCSDQSLYGGWTNDIVKRISSHNSGGGGKYTRARLPVYITYLEDFDSKEAAMSREWHLKHLTRDEKEALIAKNGIVQLRPHHLLCIQLFEGKGYSPDFTENMVKTIERLSHNPDIILTLSCDTLCSRCPNLMHENCPGKCVTEEKILRYDQSVLEKCGLKEGQILPWDKAQKLAYENILAKGILREVCTECRWGDICFNSSSSKSRQ